MLKQIACVVLAGAVAGCGNGCNRKKPAENIEPSPPAPPNMGSATVQAPAKPLTPEELAKRLDECWALWNAQKWDELKGCYAPDVVAESPGSGDPAVTGAAALVDAAKASRPRFPDNKADVGLTVIDGTHAAVIVLLNGTQKGPLKGPMGEIPPTGNKVGVLGAYLFEVDDTGHLKHELEYVDEGTILAQAAPSKAHPTRPVMDKPPMDKTLAIAKHDDKEKANIAVAQGALEAFNKHDAKAFGATWTDDAVWSEQPEPKDWTKADALKNAQDTWKAFSDIKMTPTAWWAAGDYVVVQATMEGTNDGALPTAGIKTATKKKLSVPFLAFHEIAGGKIKRSWVFYQGLAFASQLGLLPAQPATPPAAGSAAPASGSAAPKPAAPAKP